MEKVKTYSDSIWRVPLISIMAGFLYTPIYVRIVIKFGVIEPGVIDNRVSILTSAGIFIAIIILGGIIFLRRQSRKEIFVSASIVVAYGLILFLIQVVFGVNSGPIAVAFILLEQPLEWTLVFSTLSLYLKEEFGVSIFFLGWLRFFAPYLFVLYGKKESEKSKFLV